MLVKDTKMRSMLVRTPTWAGDTKMRFDVGGDTNKGRGHQHGRGEAIKQCHSGGNLLKYSI
jgi:hypothetical protein